MAKFELTGLGDIEKMLLNRETRVEAAVPEMVDAGADELIKAEQEEMERLKLVDTGDMKKSVGATKLRKTDSGGYKDVYPQGKDRKGVRNAEKAFVAQYGKSNLPARPWLTTARAKSGDKVSAAMRKAWEKKVNG